MHLGKFHHAISLIAQEIQNKQIIPKLQTITNAIANLVANPGNPDVAKSFKDNLDILREVLAASTLNKPYPTLDAMLHHIGAHEYIGDELFKRVKGALEGNQLTLQGAINELNIISADLSHFYNQVAAIDQAFTELSIEYTDLEPGETELGISIPVLPETGTLKDLSKVANTWHKALSPFVEIFSDDNEPIKVRVISSGSWQFYLLAAPPVLYGISVAIHGVNDILKKLIETKKLIKTLIFSGVGKEAIDAIEADTSSRLKNEVKELADKTVDEHYKGDDEGRENELKVHVSQSLMFIAHQLTENVTLEIRMTVPERNAPGNDSTDEQVKLAKEEYEKFVKLKTDTDRNMDLSHLDLESDEIISLIDSSDADSPDSA
jgi:hypothetical protein